MRLSRIVLVPLLLLAAVLTVAPADAAVRTLTTSYKCTATPPIGSPVVGTSKVTVSVDLPATARRGHAVASRPITFKMTVPSNLLTTLRDVGVTGVSATGSAKYRVGTKAYAIRNLAIPRTAVPASGAMTLKGAGTAAGFTPSAAGRFAVRVPARFTATVTTYGGLANGLHVPMSCGLVSGAPSRLGTLTVLG